MSWVKKRARALASCFSCGAFDKSPSVFPFWSIKYGDYARKACVSFSSNTGDFRTALEPFSKVFSQFPQNLWWDSLMLWRSLASVLPQKLRLMTLKWGPSFMLSLFSKVFSKISHETNRVSHLLGFYPLKETVNYSSHPALTSSSFQPRCYNWVTWACVVSGEHLTL